MFARFSDARKGYVSDPTYTGGRVRTKKRPRSGEEASSSTQPQAAATEAGEMDAVAAHEAMSDPELEA